MQTCTRPVHDTTIAWVRSGGYPKPNKRLTQARRSPLRMLTTYLNQPAGVRSRSQRGTTTLVQYRHPFSVLHCSEVGYRSIERESHVPAHVTGWTRGGQ